MNKRVCLYLIVFLGSTLLCSVGCSANATKREQTLLDHRKPPSSLDQVSNQETSVRFIAEPTEAPRPGAQGSFIDEQHAWVIDEGRLTRTADGGRTWQRMRPSTEGEIIFGRLGDMYVAPYFITSARGWLMAGRGTWQTENSGLTWQRIFPVRSIGPYFADSQHGWMNVYDETSETEESYVTQDGGQTWGPCGVKRSFNTQTPRQAFLLTPQHGWAITSHTDESRQTIYGVARTIDGGCHWQQLWTSNDNPDARYSDIYFLNEREGWLAGESLLYYTADGGKTWQELLLPNESINALRLYFANSKEGWIIGGHPSMSPEDTGVYHTADGGKAWRQLTESEVVKGFSVGKKHIEIPAKWKAGKLLQMLYASQS